MKKKYKILGIENIDTQEFFWKTIHFYVYGKNSTLKVEKITKLLDPRKKTINFKLNAKLNKKKETETGQKLTNNNPLRTLIQIKQNLKKTIHPVIFMRLRKPTMKLQEIINFLHHNTSFFFSTKCVMLQIFHLVGQLMDIIHIL